MAKPARPEQRKGRPVRCAIYTRKSTEEGLDQAFNSLDAQREACAAYIVSQRHEGWTELADRYDDGGYSGGSMDRPGLRQLMADVALGKVDVIVVYKVDRLTRALADFAKIVDVLDAAGASFVSITQSFNTTTSMGRLTLNVLLSFAQFEREVISERVRDKIAASKKKGMWMGGAVPLGYDVVDRKLIVNEVEAQQIRYIMQRYLDVGTVPRLVDELAAEAIVTKFQTGSQGRSRGGIAYKRGTLYHLLSNRLYRGEIVHKDQVYPGEHDAIVDDALWDAVQARLAGNGVERRSGINAKEPSLLVGMIEDDTGRRMRPTHAVKRALRYRYYVSVEDALARPEHRGVPARRVAAGDVEHAVLTALKALLDDRASLLGRLGLGNCGSTMERANDSIAALRAELDTIDGSELHELARTIGLRVVIGEGAATITCDQLLLAGRLGITGSIDPSGDDRIALPVMGKFPRRSHQKRLVVEGGTAGPPVGRDGRLIELILKAHDARRQLLDPTSDATASHYSDKHLVRLARLAFLAPDITASILDGTHPASLNARQLLRAAEIPLAWPDQRRMLGYS